MLAPDYLDHAPDRLVLLWQQVEDDILRDVARRISKMETLTPTANWQLWRYQQTETVRQDVIKKLARYTGKSEAAIRQLMQEAATRALEAEDRIYYHYNMEPTPFEDSAALQALLNAGYQQTAGTFHNLTGTTANTVSGQFEAALDRAHLKVSTGAFDYKSAIKSAVDSLADTMKYVTYPTGHQDTLEVAARREAAGSSHGRNARGFCGNFGTWRRSAFSRRMAGAAVPPGRGCGLSGQALP